MPVYECRNSDFLLSDLVDYEGEQEQNLKNYVHNRFSIQSLNDFDDHQSDEITICSKRNPRTLSKYSEETPSFESVNYFNEYLTVQSMREMKNQTHDNITVVGDQGLVCNDIHVHEEVRKIDTIQDDDISLATTLTDDISCISEKTYMTLTSTVTYANDIRRGFLAKFLNSFDNMRSGLALEIEAEKAKQAQLGLNNPK